MARRLGHVQQNLFNQAGTKPHDRRGGKRKRAGRKPKNGVRAGVSHDARPEFPSRFPISITLRVLPIIETLRDFDIYPAFQKATIVAARFGQMMGDDKWFRIVHMSIQSDHVHLLVEASDKDALSRGMQSFKISAAKWLNHAIGKRHHRPRKGTVFADRYFSEIIDNPLQTRRAIAYVLNNWRKHERDRTITSSKWRVDPFSSGVLFTGWKDLGDLGIPRWKTPDGYLPLTMLEPRTWLLRVGWKRYGLVPCHELPTPRMFAKHE